MKNTFERKISTAALIVSILSLAATILLTVAEYKENIEVVTGKVFISSVDLDDRIIYCEVELLVANPSRTSTSVLYAKGYKYFPGFRATEEFNISAEPDLPIMLIQGDAEKIIVQCQYPLEEEELLALQNGTNPSDALDGYGMQIRIYSIKNKMYSDSVIRFDNVEVDSSVAILFKTEA